MDLRDFYKVMSPRLTVLVTTTDLNGKADGAPFSFVSPISFDPPLLMISIGINKHSYWNITQKKEFVINIPTKKILDKVWTAGGKWDPKMSKIERAGLKIEPAKKVGPPRLKDCVAHIECYLEDAKKVGDHVIVIGKVIEMNVDSKFSDKRRWIGSKQDKATTTYLWN